MRESGLTNTLVHGRSSTREYHIWEGMLQRCTNPNRRYFKHYGGRGIVICERWKTFTNFLDDMGKAPAEMTLDRIDNDGHYEPSNCRWASRREQARNQSSNVRIEYCGAVRTIAEIAELSGIRPGTLYSRIARGWSAARATGSAA